MQVYLLLAAASIALGSGLAWYKVSSVLIALIFFIFVGTIVLVCALQEKSKKLIFKTTLCLADYFY
ncbi:MAG: hypothetical protein SFU25_07955 [Candidatus Caenarcaniphilales bacterium]|nr:hypothetical protein [Candidatus Caenarcaniphilales bacterium]